MKSLFEWLKREAHNARTENRNQIDFRSFFEISLSKTEMEFVNFTTPFETQQTCNIGLSEFKALVGRLYREYLMRVSLK
jgi:uncharacterized protein YozE (UPF0346 family)